MKPWFDEQAYAQFVRNDNELFHYEENMFRKFVNVSFGYIARGPPGNVTASATAHIGVKQGPDFVKSRMM
jgi:hypothetical protein